MEVIPSFTNTHNKGKDDEKSDIIGHKEDEIQAGLEDQNEIRNILVASRLHVSESMNAETKVNHKEPGSSRKIGESRVVFENSLS